MTKYWLYYETMTEGKFKQHFTVLFDFAKALDKAMENSFVNQESISFWTSPA